MERAENGLDSLFNQVRESVKRRTEKVQKYLEYERCLANFSRFSSCQKMVVLAEMHQLKKVKTWNFKEKMNQYRRKVFAEYFFSQPTGDFRFYSFDKFLGFFDDDDLHSYLACFIDNCLEKEQLSDLELKNIFSTKAKLSAKLLATEKYIFDWLKQNDLWLYSQYESASDYFGKWKGISFEWQWEKLCFDAPLRLYDGLVANGFLNSEETTKEDFLQFFDSTGLYHFETPIKWKGTIEELSYFLYYLDENKGIIKPEYQKTIENFEVFHSNKGKIITSHLLSQYKTNFKNYKYGELPQKSSILEIIVDSMIK